MRLALTPSPNQVRCLDTGEALSARDLEQLYSAAPLGTAFEWAARSRAAQAQGGVGDASPARDSSAAARRASVYQSGSPATCRVLPT